MLTRAGKAAAVVGSIVAVQLLPMSAYADPSPSPIVIMVDDVTAQATPCQLDSHYLYSSPPTATVEHTSTGETDFVWHATPHAAVSSADPCVTGVKLTTQLTDATTMPNCPPVVQSPVFTAASNEPLHWAISGITDYEVDDPATVKVPYYDAPGVTQSADDALVEQVDIGDGTSGRVLTPKCFRLHSTVTETSTAYYANAKHQYIPYCTEQVTFEFVATPAGPQQVGDGIVQSTC